PPEDPPETLAQPGRVPGVMAPAPALTLAGVVAGVGEAGHRVRRVVGAQGGIGPHMAHRFLQFRVPGLLESAGSHSRIRTGDGIPPHPRRSSRTPLPPTIK